MLQFIRITNKSTKTYTIKNIKIRSNETIVIKLKYRSNHTTKYVLYENHGYNELTFELNNHGTIDQHSTTGKLFVYNEFYSSDLNLSNGLRSGVITSISNIKPLYTLNTRLVIN